MFKNAMSTIGVLAIGFVGGMALTNIVLGEDTKDVIYEDDNMVVMRTTTPNRHNFDYALIRYKTEKR